MRARWIQHAGASLAAAALPGGAIAIPVTADYCGRIVSPDGTYSASFTLRRDNVPSARMITVRLCDRWHNCDAVFSAPRDARAAMEWRDDGELIVTSNRGSATAPGALSQSGSGRPPVRIRIERRRVPATAAGLVFDARVCRVEGPVTSTQVPPR
jgi:hypothetical protein